jgi:voltage-gated potassium channel
VKSNRRLLLKQLEQTFEVPLIVLGFAWLLLLIVELVFAPNRVLTILSTIIWIIFIADFVVKFLVTPEKWKFIKTNFITIVSLAVPAFRVLRIFRLLRLLRLSRGLRLVKVLASLNRGIRSLSKTMQRRALGYVILLTLIVVFGGAAGMYAFEKDVPDGLTDYGTAVWWTTMIMTTLGSQYWPVTLEGRILCVILSLFAFTIFGYLTASLATFFVGQDAENKRGEIAGTAQINELKSEIINLRKMIEQLRLSRPNTEQGENQA